jgi:acyl-CoA synthetase (AMP-forming)/AMP-acid ligase II
VGAVDVTGGRSVWDLVRHWSDPALVHEAPDPDAGLVTLTWEQLATTALEARRRLASVGVGHGATVVMAMPNSPVTLVL